MVSEMELELVFEKSPLRRKLPGAQWSGKLTRRLFRRENQGPARDVRDVLLVPERDIPLDEAFRREFEALRSGASSVRGTRLYWQKHLVNRILDRDPAVQKELPNVGIVVHRFGPVPAYIVPETRHSTIWDGERIEVEVAVLPRQWEDCLKQATGPCDTPAEFVRSLEGNLEPILLRYISDISLMLKSIEERCNCKDAFELCKKIEDKIGASVQTKLDALTPFRKERGQEVITANWSNHRPDLTGATRESVLRLNAYSQASDEFIVGRYLRSAVLYMVNETYRHLGLDSRSLKYVQRLQEIRRQADAMHGDRTFERIIESRPAVQRVFGAIQAYISEDRAYFAERMEEPASWDQRLARYVTFLHHLQEWGQLSPHFSRVFISKPHHGTVAPKVVHQLQQWFAHEAKAGVERELHVLVIEEGGQVKFKETIKAALWLCDLVICIYPNDCHDFRWLARECEHALLLRKSVYTVIQEGVSPDAIRACMRPETILVEASDKEAVKKAEDLSLELLAPAAWAKPGRAQNLLAYFNENSFTKFRVDGPGIDPRLETMLLGMQERLLSERKNALIQGYLRQFRRSDRLVYRILEGAAPWPDKIKKAALVEKLQSDPDFDSRHRAGNTIQTAAIRAKERRLGLMCENEENELFSLLHRPQAGYYSGRLRVLLRELRPDYEDGEIDSWLARIWDAVQNHLDSL